jgi:hypothetical protein
MIDVASGIHESFAAGLISRVGNGELPNSQKPAGFRDVQPFFVNSCDTA